MSRAGGSQAEALDLRLAVCLASAGWLSGAGMLGAAAPAAHAAGRALRAAAPELRLHQPGKGAQGTRGPLRSGPCWTVIWCMRAGDAGWLQEYQQLSKLRLRLLPTAQASAATAKQGFSTGSGSRALSDTDLYGACIERDLA